MASHDDVIAAARAQVRSALGSQSASDDRPAALRDASGIAGRIDHTLLRADATDVEIARICDEAIEYGFASVCVNSRWVPFVAERLAGAAPLTCSVVGFPLGAMSAQAKAAETSIAVDEGADEVDMVIDLGGLKSGDLVAVYDDMRAVVVAAAGRPVKVIIETCLLDDVQKAVACELAVRAGAAYVKTSTGFSAGGATAHDVRLMRAVVGDALGVKASGGVRTRVDADAMLEAGADRLGASASIAIVTAS